MSKQLIDQLTTVMSTTFALYTKAQQFHWNVKGGDFYSLHKLFGDIYEDVYRSIDQIAEHIQARGGKASGDLSVLNKQSKIKGSSELSPDDMVATLIKDNALVLKQLNRAMDIATKEKQHGLANLLGARIEQHDKWNWFLTSTGDKSMKLLRELLAESKHANKKKRKEKLTRSIAAAVYHRDYVKTRNKEYRQYDPEEENNK